jgi:hypothetical protein
MKLVTVVISHLEMKSENACIISLRCAQLYLLPIFLVTFGSAFFGNSGLSVSELVSVCPEGPR